VPKNTPGAIVEKLNSEVVRALSEPEMKERFSKLGATSRSTTPDEFASYIANEIAKWGRVVRESGAKVE